MAQNWKHCLAVISHFVVLCLILQLLTFVLPNCALYWYNNTASALLLLYIANITCGFTTKTLLKERIHSDNKAVLITGCDSGFGHELARRMDSLGFKVFAGCLLPSGQGAIELKSKCSERLKIMALDVTNENSMKEAVDFVKSNLDTSELWAIVNNAGILKGCSSEFSSIEVFRETMEVNAFGPIRITQAFLPLLRQSKGRVINVNSRAARVVLPHFCPYTMSKWASLAFTLCLKHEIEFWGIKVISIEPEVFQSGMTGSFYLREHFDGLLRNVDERIKDEYGENYLKNYRRIPKIMGALASSNVKAVIDTLESAICLKYPSSVYQPCRNFLTKIFMYFGEFEFINCIFFKVGSYLCGIYGSPKTKKIS